MVGYENNFYLIDYSKRLWAVRQRNIVTAEYCLNCFMYSMVVIGIFKEI